MAPANVLHGAVREHGLASSPTPETQVRVACAEAVDAAGSRMPPRMLLANERDCIAPPGVNRSRREDGGRPYRRGMARSLARKIGCCFTEFFVTFAAARL